MKFLIVGLFFSVLAVAAPKLGLRSENSDYRIEMRFTFPNGMIEKHREWEEEGDCDTMWMPRQRSLDYYEGSSIEISAFRRATGQFVTKRLFPIDITIDRAMMSGEYKLPLINDGTRTELIVYYGGNFYLDAVTKESKVFDVRLTDWRNSKYNPGFGKLITSYTTTDDPRSKYKDEESKIEYLEY